VAEHPISLDDRRLLVELQSLGVRVEDESGSRTVPGRRGGAGPSDAGFLWIRGLPLTVPMHSRFAHRSPYRLRLLDHGGAKLYRGDEYVGPAAVPPQPHIYGMETADGIPYWKIALLHLDSIASTVVQKCIYWGTHEQCRFCGIELTRGEQTIPVKTPAQLAEVCTAARDFDGAVDVTLTTGSLNRRDRGARYIATCAAAIKEACGLPVQVQFEPPDDPAVLSDVRDAGVDAVGIHIETFDPAVLAHVAPGKAVCGVEGYFRCWERAVEVFGRGRVSTYVILGLGERRSVTEEGCRRGLPVRRAAAAGAGHVDGRRPAARPRLRRGGLPLGLGDARRRRARPRRRGRGLRALPGLLGAVGVGAGVPEGGAAWAP
jgi:radical SAM protein (TIGR04043 family)